MYFQHSFPNLSILHLFLLCNIYVFYLKTWFFSGWDFLTILFIVAIRKKSRFQVFFPCAMFWLSVPSYSLPFCVQDLYIHVCIVIESCWQKSSLLVCANLDVDHFIGHCFTMEWENVSLNKVKCSLTGVKD